MGDKIRYTTVVKQQMKVLPVHSRAVTPILLSKPQEDLQ